MPHCHGCAAKLTAAEVALLEAPAAPAEGPAAAAGGGAAIAEAIVAAGGEPGEAGMGLMRAAVERKADGLAAKVWWGVEAGACLRV